MPTKEKGKGKVLAKKNPVQRDQKHGKAEMDRRKAEGAGFYC